MGHFQLQLPHKKTNEQLSTDVTARETPEPGGSTSWPGPGRKGTGRSFIGMCCPSPRLAQHCTVRLPWSLQREERWTSCFLKTVGTFLGSLFESCLTGNHWGNLWGSATGDETETEKRDKAYSNQHADLGKQVPVYGGAWAKPQLVAQVICRVELVTYLDRKLSGSTVWFGPQPMGHIDYGAPSTAHPWQRSECEATPLCWA